MKAGRADGEEECVQWQTDEGRTMLGVGLVLFPLALFIANMVQARVIQEDGISTEKKKKVSIRLAGSHCPKNINKKERKNKNNPWVRHCCCVKQSMPWISLSCSGEA